jgi:hypothetical protein
MLTINITDAAIKNRHSNDTSGATTPSCDFNGSQLVDQPKTTMPYSSNSKGLIGRPE